MPPLHQSQSASSSSASSLASRRIRFAPLPDPRALDADDDDDDHSDNNHNDDVQHKPIDLPAPSPPKPTAQQLLSHPPIPQPTWRKPKSINLLRPFPLRRSSNASSHSLTPTPSNIDPCPTPTRSSFSGTINLFRTSSKSSDTTPPPSASSSSGWRFNLSPLSRAQSAQQQPTPKLAVIPGGGRRPASVDSKAQAQLHSPLRKGTRMLNGRVYGARRPNANPFANARDEDPEFVEWGHGGMGSVRGAVHAGIGVGIAENGPRTRWERLGGAVVDEDDYDGSGMGWVKKRKEARERAEREAKEKEEKENEKPVQIQPELPTIPDATPLEHNLTTVTLPHLTRHHSHRRPSSRGTSVEGAPIPATTSVQRHPHPHPHPHTHAHPSSSPSETESETESESNPERGDDDDDDDDDDDEEDEEMQQRRKTALGAGVEKVSRHQEN